ncbi:hypothetical protein FBEOM_7884 [Fusarium beomiforme]|uniref:Uncharacterized protein n=1 Tax=Fusarium beomiforme TaxID=44412 RepID=A0A9P5DXA8_9HYPO|nr:hypothetical protein FBEOM_7884 [Fusarium beomiforme]
MYPVLMRPWLGNMPNLRYFKLGGTRPSRGLYVEWHHIFDAIRDHPNVSGPSPKGLAVEFGHMRSAHWTRMIYRVVICHDSSIATERHTHDTDPDGLNDENYSLEKHFYNELRFKGNHGLRYLLDDLDVDMVESDSEDDEDEEWVESSGEEEH